MGWWKRFNDWIDGSIDKATEDPLKDWEPTPLIWVPNDQPTRAECSDVQADVSSLDSAPVAIPSTSDPTRSDEGSDEKSDSGGERQWFPCETIEGEPPVTEEPLEHAEYLPSATFRVFPVAGNHRNSYDSEGSVRRAVAARKGSGFWRRTDDGSVWVPDVVKVYQAETVWRDVTSEYVKP